ELVDHRRQVGDPGVEPDLGGLPVRAPAAARVVGDEQGVRREVPPGRLDAAGERGLGDESGAPHLVEQLALVDDALAVHDEVPQHLEHLGLDRDELAGASQLEPHGVELVAVELVDHGAPRKPAERTAAVREAWGSEWPAPRAGPVGHSPAAASLRSSSPPASTASMASSSETMSSLSMSAPPCSTRS